MEGWCNREGKGLIRDGQEFEYLLHLIADKTTCTSICIKKCFSFS